MILSTISAVRCAIGTMRALRHTQTVRAANWRGLCSKPQAEGIKPQCSTPKPAFPADAQNAFRIPGYKPSEFDRKVLIWSGRFKTPEQIPEFVSMEMIDAARNKVRVKVCYAMMALTVFACMAMIFMGKKAASRHESLTSWNMEKKARLREEALCREDGEALASGKAQ